MNACDGAAHLLRRFPPQRKLPLATVITIPLDYDIANVCRHHAQGQPVAVLPEFGAVATRTVCTGYAQNGNYPHRPQIGTDYSSGELSRWADRIFGSGADEAWIYFNNDRSDYVVKRALALRRLLRARNAKSATPKTVRSA